MFEFAVIVSLERQEFRRVLMVRLRCARCFKRAACISGSRVYFAGINHCYSLV
jgi:hypothetical protein